MPGYPILPRRSAWLLLVVCGLGCSIFSPRLVVLPSNDQIVRDRLVVYCDFSLPRRHRLLDELVALQDDMTHKLVLKSSDEPINIYLFNNEQKYNGYMRENHPDFPYRRAFFVESDTDLQVYAHWGERIAEDLRHEVAHGYLHSVVPNLPLWLDEGLAEYYEVTRGRHGINWPHIQLLEQLRAEGTWAPDLKRLEDLYFANEMEQVDYAEAWLWVHMLLESKDEKLLKILQDQLARLRIDYESAPLSQQIDKSINNPDQLLLTHLEQLAKHL